MPTHRDDDSHTRQDPERATPRETQPGRAPAGASSSGPRPGIPLGMERIGPYRLLERLGSGGMGTVYLAEQREMVQRRVALKVIRMDRERTPERIARMELERQALALMDHPAIARIYDGGTTADGEPWFALEYVPGEDITGWCDSHRLGLEARLDLFRELCAGVQHAHHKGVVHRDLKPSNILVREVDGRPALKIIDFGIARSLTGPLTDKTVYTEEGAQVGTFRYMSPEQAEGSRIDVDTRADVYSLGVVLHQLLVGAVPFHRDDQTDMEFLEALRTREPERPSRLLGRAANRESESQRRGTDVKGLLRTLRGDLDFVVLKALRKERDLRYQTPAELAADVERFQQGRPVMARRGTSGYRARKFVARHRVALGVGLLITGLLTAGIAGTLRGQWEAQAKDRDFHLLSRYEAFGQLVARADAATAQWPEEPQTLQQVLDEAEAMLAERAVLQQALADLEREREEAPDGLPLERQFLLGSLGKLLTRLDELQADTPGDAPHHGLVPDLQRRIAWCATERQQGGPGPAGALEAAGANSAQSAALDATSSRGKGPTWDDVQRDLDNSPIYQGLDLPLQRGLIPLGADPDSGLQEFLHLRSTAPGLTGPFRGSDRQLKLTPDWGVVLVLLPSADAAALGAQCTSPGAPLYDPGLDQETIDTWYLNARRRALAEVFLAKFELTQEQWMRLDRGRNPSSYPVNLDDPSLSIGTMHPLENVPADRAAVVLQSHGLSLPTPNQWERAARGPSVSPWWTGTEEASLIGRANLCGSEVPLVLGWPIWAEHTDPFSAHGPVHWGPKNPLGLHNILGNVSEWCARMEPNPWIAKGGSFSGGPMSCRAAMILMPNPKGVHDVGIRPARDVIR